MILHLFYKEWLKTKWFILLSLLLGIGVIAYIYIALNSKIINSEGASAFLHNWLTRGGRPFYQLFLDIPFVVAIVIGLSQFVPEVLQKRIKLTLHLPANEIKLLYMMVLYGFIVMLSLMIVFLVVYFSLDLYFMTTEIHKMAFEAFLPAILGGITTYFFVAMIAMEPSWLHKFLYAIFVYGLIEIFRLNLSLQHNMYLFIAILVIASLSMIYTANRFKIGEK